MPDRASGHLRTLVKHSLKRILPTPVRSALRAVQGRVKLALGLPVPLLTVDRPVLEQIILPYFSTNGAAGRVLFVGCASYTRHYWQILEGTDYWTIDPDPAVRKWGSRNHLVIRLEELDHHFAESRFDLIVSNGVLGFGLNDREACEKAFELCFSRLSAGGAFVLGWDDWPQTCPVRPEEFRSLTNFEKWTFLPLEAHRYLTSPVHRHTFDFYQKPAPV